MRTHTTIQSPIGDLTLVAEDGLVAGIFMDEHRHGPTSADLGTADAAAFGAVTEQLREYFAGRRREFDLTVAPVGTEFQRRVWQQLRAIPYGSTISYGELARRIGQPSAVRAVGLANGRNPVSIVVPCHRVIGSTGALTGYGGGVERKRFLLELELAASAEELLFPLSG